MLVTKWTVIFKEICWDLELTKLKQKSVTKWSSAVPKSPEDPASGTMLRSDENMNNKAKANNKKKQFKWTIS